MPESKDSGPHSNRPKDNAFQQQKLKAWQPLLTPGWVYGTFAVIGTLFVVLGLIIMSASNSVYEAQELYQDNDEETSVTFTFGEDVKGPVYLYYELTNFFQNHRRYVKSRSDAQLRGEEVSSSDLEDACSPLAQWDDQDLYPCGLIANSFFNDTFLVAINGNSFEMNEEDIHWASDESKFIARDLNDDETNIGPGGFPLPNPVNDPHFMVWMRTAGLSDFRKLYGIIDEDFVEGDILTVEINNTFPVTGFDGTKAVVISTTSWLGGKNSFLGLCYLITGIVSLVLALAFFAKHKLNPRELGDMKYFNWPDMKSVSAAVQGNKQSS